MAEGGYSERELAELRQLLLGVDRARLLAALDRLEQRGKFADLQSQSLGDAMRLALQRDPTFAAGMGDLIGKGVHATVQRDSHAFGQALAPALGPAIRKSVQLMLQGVLQSIEHTVDQRLSLKSMRWRWEARRSGRTFAEVAFLHTMLYRVEHVFLVHREGGVQLLHTTPPGVTTREPEAIAGMLTAIQDFAHDAFAAPGDDTLTSFAVGELQVQVETGSHALLAGVVRGQMPPAVRERLRDALDRIETAMGAQLAAFAGEIDPFEAMRPHVETCLLESGRADQPKARRGGALRWVLATAALALVAWGAVAWYRGHQDRGRLLAFLAALQDEPGYVVTASEGFAVRGLRDPLARDPDTVLREHHVDGLVTTAWQPYLALDSSFVQQRFAKALHAPDTVTLELAGATATLRGAADHACHRRAQDLASGFPGIDRVDLSGLSDTDRLAFDHAAVRLRQLPLPVAALQPVDSEDRRSLVALLRELAGHAALLQQTVVLQPRFQLAEDAPDDDLAVARTVAEAIAREAGCDAKPLVPGSGAGLEPGVLRFDAALR